MQLSKLLGALGITLALLACGSNEESDSADSANMENAPVKEPQPDAPQLFDEASEKSDAIKSQPEQMSCPESAQCFGSLVVEPGTMVLNRSSNKLTVTGTISLTNRSAEPVSVAALDPATINLDNGNQLSINMSNTRQFSGIIHCRRDGQSCFDKSASEFRQISSNDSAARLNVTFFSYVDEPTQRTLPDVKSGNISMRFFVVPAGGQGRSIDVSLPDIALRNQIKG